MVTRYLDKEGVLRVGSRLNNANLTQSATHPIILPIKSKLTTLILESTHKSTLHGSPQLMLATARQKYWIISGRIPFQSVYWKCVICTCQRALVSQQLMGQLSSARCNPNPAFINTGVDFAGPFILKKWLGRCKQTYKAYIAVFVCFATSATHLEVVNGLSTEEFIAAYRRFTSLQGVCKNLYSDCGTNFVGAIKELQSLRSQANDMCDFAHQLSLEGTNWHLNPPGAPHQGGKWEAGVKSIKHHLSRIMGATLYTYHQLDTLVKQISAQLNSRPLCPMTNDPNDLKALTPGYFLIGGTMNAILEGQLLDINDGKLSRWQLIQKHSQQLWSNDYIKQFHVRTKSCTSDNSIQLNSMVIMMDERVPLTKWPLARVVQLHPGDDGLVRVVTIKTCTSTFKRPISKLRLLPVNPDE